MKITTLLTIPFIVFAASSETLTVQEHRSIHNTNNRPIVKMQKKNKMHQLHQINEQEAALIAKKETKEESLSIDLSHRGEYLLFKVRTANYRVSINALDGTVMKKEKIKEER